MLRLLSSKIGLSLIAAIIIIGVGVALKLQVEKPKSDIRAKIDLIASTSIKKALESGQIDNSEWEKALKIANASSTIDEKIANLQNLAQNDEEEENLTATDRFSRALLEKYVKYKNAGGVIDENTTIRFVNELLIKDYGGPEEEKIYTIDDITVLDTNGADELKRYGNYMGSILNTPLPENYENEILIINRVYETDNPVYLDQLPQNIERYTFMRNKASAIAVPNALKEIHVAFLNSISAIIEGIRGMLLIDSDPIGATKMVLRYEDGFQSLDVSLSAITSYLKNQNITFSSSESGYLFYK